jgi:hypothetical protein
MHLLDDWLRLHFQHVDVLLAGGLVLAVSMRSLRRPSEYVALAVLWGLVLVGCVFVGLMRTDSAMIHGNLGPSVVLLALLFGVPLAVGTCTLLCASRLGLHEAPSHLLALGAMLSSRIVMADVAAGIVAAIVWTFA